MSEVARKIYFSFLSPSLGASAGNAGTRSQTNPSYDLELRVEPDAHRISVRAVIETPPGCSFYLNEYLKIQRMTCQGKEVTYTRDDSGELALYTDHGRVVELENDVSGTLEIEYSGCLPEIENKVNMVQPNLVELACYATWYPIFVKSRSFSFRLQIDVPTGFVTTTNGRRLGGSEKAGRRISRWESYGNTSDMVVVSSPLLQEAYATEGQLRVEMLYANLEATTINKRIAKLRTALSELSTLYGPPKVDGILRFVYSPRDGWGYSRMPLFVVPERDTKEQEKLKFGSEQSLHGAVHELAHFWWGIANSSTSDDWINEGIAEYSAFRLAKLLSGTAFQQHLFATYNKHAQEGPAEVAIIDTPADSKARYVNRYERTTLMFLKAAERFGQERLDNVLREMLSSKASRPATTQSFLKTTGRHMGAEAEAFFSECLCTPGCPAVLDGTEPK